MKVGEIAPMEGYIVSKNAKEGAAARRTVSYLGNAVDSERQYSKQLPVRVDIEAKDRPARRVKEFDILARADVFFQVFEQDTADIIAEEAQRSFLIFMDSPTPEIIQRICENLEITRAKAFPAPVQK